MAVEKGTNGAIFYVLLFTTDQWPRLVPTSWDVFPNALSTQLQYLSLRFPADDGWLHCNSLQQLAYFVTVFIAAPLAVFTGLMQGPAIGSKLGWLGRTFHRQRARSMWSGVAKWAGVPMRHVLDLVKPKPEARYVVFYSLSEGAEGGRYL